MEERLKSNSVGTWDPWVILIGLLSLVILFIFTSSFMSVVLERSNLLLSIEWLERREVIIAKFLVVLYCLKQYGPIQLSEFIPRGRDYAVLAIGLIIISSVSLVMGLVCLVVGHNRHMRRSRFGRGLD